MSPEEEKVINRNTMKLQDHLYKALKQRDQYKSERDTLIDDLKVLREKNEELEDNNEQLNEIFNYQEKKKHEYRAENEKLERENGQLSELNKQLTFENINSEHEIKALREQNYKYCKLGNHIRLKAENNPGVSRYIDLVNFIDRLEKGDN